MKLKDDRIEGLLGKHPDILWQYMESVPVASIDRNESHKNQARASGNPVLDSVVDEYVAAIRNGDEFPALVGYYSNSENNSIVLCDGIQRTEAYIKTRKPNTDIYIILTEDPLERILISYECNIRNGHTASELDRLVHARNLVQQHEFKVAEVSKMFNISKDRIQEGIDDYDGAERAKDHSAFSDWNKIDAKKVRTRIHRAIKMDSVFSLVLKLVANYKVTSGELTSIFARINSYSSEEDQLVCIRGILTQAEKAKREAQDRRGSYMRDNPLSVLDIHWSYWNANSQGKMDIVRAMTTDERNSARPKVAEAVRVLQKIQAEIG